MQALARANRVRLARAELKRSIARGDVDAAEVVRDCPWETESMTLAELLTSQRRWGRTRARKFLLGARAEREQAARHPHPAPARAARRPSWRAKPQRRATPDSSERADGAPDAAQPRRPPTLKLRPPEARWKARRRARKAATKATAPTPRQTARISPAR